jgi:hypothetical protein
VNKENLWVVVALIIVVGTFLISQTVDFLTLTFLIILTFFVLEIKEGESWKTRKTKQKRLRKTRNVPHQPNPKRQPRSPALTNLYMPKMRAWTPRSP